MTVCLSSLIILSYVISIASDNRWTYVGIDSICSFKIPPTMEVQSKEYNDLSSFMYKKMHPDKALIFPNSEKKIICQQNGLNSLNEKSRKLYVRVIFEEEKSNDTLQSLYDKMLFSEDELNDISNTIQNEIINRSNSINFKLTSKVLSRVTSINGMNCLCTSYKRIIENNPEVIVHIYTFFNKNVIDRFTVSYRVTESHLWKNDLERVISSLKIIEK